MFKFNILPTGTHSLAKGVLIMPLSDNGDETWVKIGQGDYLVEPLNEEIEGNKGGNSIVYKLFDPQEEEYSIIKISKYSTTAFDWKIKKKGLRFQREITAMEIASSNELENVLEFVGSGIIFQKVSFLGTEYTMKFPFYIMEEAESDLSNYLEENEIGIQQKIILCSEALNAVNQLHNIDVYHRDIKHDNFFMVNGLCKVGDLGLVKFRNKEDRLDGVGEKIGPFGWESPETMNKSLTERNDMLSFDCEIDDMSDVFQLGKLFWYILQGNLPIGQIIIDDFEIEDEDLFNLIYEMLFHAKENRPSINEVIERFELIMKNYSA